MTARSPRQSSGRLKEGRRLRLFVASLSDVFEDHAGVALRVVALRKLARLKNVDVLLLTKRPENVLRMVPPEWLVDSIGRPDHRAWPAHVWVGTTVEDEPRAKERIRHLARIPAGVRFLSMEPLLGPVDIAPWLGYADTWDRYAGPCGCDERRDPWTRCESCEARGWEPPELRGIQWVITGSESGPRTRTRSTHPAWYRSIRDACAAAGVPYLHKQNGDLGVRLRKGGPWAALVALVETMEAAELARHRS